MLIVPVYRISFGNFIGRKSKESCESRSLDLIFNVKSTAVQEVVMVLRVVTVHLYN